MLGTFGRYLDVDLTSGEVSDYEIPQSWEKLHLGGRGIAARILERALDGGEDALGPSNVIVFGTGPLQGTGVPGASRHLVMAISPKTKCVSGAYAGGRFGDMIGKSGYDGIVVRGESRSPVCLTLIDGEARIQNAQQLWGLGTGETEKRLKTKYPKASISSIGCAGENLVSFSCIINDRSRAAGRSGLGAVLGKKKLKAIVVEGSQKKQVHDPVRLQNLRKEFAQMIRGNPDVMDVGKLGTSGALLPLNEVGLLPTRNFKAGQFSGAEKISGERLFADLLVKRDTCVGCPIRCKRVVKGTFNGKPIVPEFGGPEYETIAAFGSLCCNDDLSSIALMNQMCNDYGLDTISTGVTLAFAMEAEERGSLTTGLRWGDASTMVEMITAIAQRDGQGDVLARGIQQLASEISADFAAVVKGLEVPMHEPRGKCGVGLSYATSPRGANHMEVFHEGGPSGFLPSELPVPELVDWGSWDNRPEYCKTYEELCSFTNSLILCAIASWDIMGSGGYYPYPTIREIVHATTGSELDVKGMLKVGERNYLLLRLLAKRAGYTRNDDGLPKRFESPLEGGPLAGAHITEKALKAAIDEYYHLRGYDEHGHPTREKLIELGLADLVEPSC